MKKTIVTITGPSASGKSHLERKLVESGHFYKAVSTTTREPRPGEVDGVDYFFISREKFGEKNRNGDFIESVFFKGNGYAVDVAEVNRAFVANKHVAIVCEPHGAKQIQRFSSHNGLPSLKVFVTNSEGVLLNRFVQREFTGLLTPAQIRYKSTRLNNLIDEELQWRWRDDWDLVIDAYDSENEDSVIGFVINHANSRYENMISKKEISAA